MEKRPTIPLCDLYIARPDIIKQEDGPLKGKDFCQIQAVRQGEKKCFHAQRRGSGGMTPPNCHRVLRSRRIPAPWNK
ncbi:MAG: hypothetical protein HYW86_04960 [Candidatus Roizmanbacteria bacterium]|nr:MAG: hypothetical protein HYW86_04960 [Candidatus Roizmanbacteria bacterium]